MRIICITGPSGAGKTYSSRIIGKRLDMPVISADELLLKFAARMQYEISNTSLDQNHGIVRHPEFIDIVQSWWNEAKGDMIIEGNLLSDNQIFHDKLMELAAECQAEVSKLYLLPDYYAWARNYVQLSSTRINSVKNYGGSISRVSIVDGWDYITSEEAILPYRPYQGKVINTADKWKILNLDAELSQQRVLDLCCNEGDYTAYAIEAGASKVLGLDHNWQSIAAARGRHPGVMYRTYDCDRADLIPGEWDYVFLFASLHYFRDIDGMLARIAKKTDKCFVFEGVVADDTIKGDYLVYRDVPYKDFVPTECLLEKLLRKHFSVVKNEGASIAPGDSSRRIIYKCYKGGQSNGL